MEIKCTPQELKELIKNKTSVADTTDKNKTIDILLNGKKVN